MEQRTVLITGASAGIGLELARLFAKHRHHLVLVARDGGRLEAARSELAGQGVGVTVIRKDLAQPGAAGEVAEEVRARGLHVDILVNNAGAGLYGKFHELPLEGQLDMIRLNTVALTELTYLLLRPMIGNGYGRILNVGSISSVVATPSMGVYAATKAYVLSFSEALNGELRDKGDIAVTALCPGFTRTGFFRESGLGRLERLVERIAMPPAFVARAGYAALRRKQPVRVPGALNASMAVMIRLLPRAWVRLVVRKLFL